jgi:hypothetical protein
VLASVIKKVARTDISAVIALRGTWAILKNPYTRQTGVVSFVAVLIITEIADFSSTILLTYKADGVDITTV